MIPDVSASPLPAALEFDPALEILLACARRDLRPVDRERANRALAAGVDWRRAVALARRHRLVPLLHRHAAAIAIPDPARDELRHLADRAARHSLRLVQELIGLLDACANAGLRIVPLKGPVLADCAYGSPALRHVDDLDLLYRAEDFRALKTILRARGFEVPAWDTPDPRLYGSFHAVTLRGPRGAFTIDLHTALLAPRGRRRWSYDLMAPRLRQRGFLGRPIEYLSDADALVYACEHGGGHAWQRLEWMAAAAALHEQFAGDPRELAEAIEFFGARRRVASALALAASLLGTRAPDSGPDLRVRASTRLVSARLRDPFRAGRDVSIFEIFAYQLLTDPTLAAGAHRCWITFTRATPAEGTPSRSRVIGVIRRQLGLVRRHLGRPRPSPGRTRR